MYRILLLLFLLPFVGCKKSLQGPPVETKDSVLVQFDASAYDNTASLYVQIFDTDTKHVYYIGNTNTSSYSGSTYILQGTSVTFSVTSTVSTNINSQITYNNQAVAIGTFNAKQLAGQLPQVVLYYKIP